MKVINNILTNIRNPSQRRNYLLLASGTFILLGWGLALAWNWNRGRDALMIAAALIAGYDILLRAWQGLKNKQANIELLVSIAAIGGLAIGEYWESAAVTFLFLLGAWLESRTLNRTRNTLRELISLAPATAIVLNNGTQEEIPAKNVDREQLVLIKPGSKIPVDGTVKSGYTSIDESAVTGEPLPVEKAPGAEVFAGTMNQNGLIKVRATRAGTDTTLAKIIRRVEEAQEDKAPTQRFIERFARWYTPAIVVLSVAAFFIWGNLELTLTLLVIGCPGALVISTPVSIITGIGRAAKKGMLIKGGEHLETAAKISAVALDKTGTLTEGKPRLTDVISFHPEQIAAGNMADNIISPTYTHFMLGENAEENLPEEAKELLYWTGIAEKGSEHPLSKPLVEEAQKYYARLPEPDHFEAVPGFGIQAEYKTDSIRVGTVDFMEQAGISVCPEVRDKITELAREGRTVVLAALNGVLLGTLGISDPIRPDAGEMVARLRANGIKRIVMLTGDNEDTAKAVAAETGVDEVRARMLPENKLEAIRQLQKEGYKVAMVGDGINDAPAMAAADIGIAMGATGTDTAIETADIALMTEDLTRIPEALRMSKLTLQNISQNIVIALATVTALLAGVLNGSVHMSGGMLIHELSVMLVIINGIRLKWA